jgi:tetratricopeptide (TPR) repeat protein
MRMANEKILAPLRVNNEPFLVASTIDRCPKTMMLRELVINAIEAACQAAPQRKRIEIGYQEVAGAAKLSIWNTGPGMSAVELDRICDIASSLGKDVSLDGNFGMGAKVASLPSNKNGLVIRSCKNGQVSQVILGDHGGVYGRRLQADAATGAMERVIDVSSKCVGYDLSHEWTEIVLNGNRPGQDTVVDPYDGAPDVPSNWITTYLVQRFFRFPPDLTLTLLPGVGGPQERQVLPLSSQSGAFTRVEAVPLPGGATAHYYYKESGFTPDEVQAGLADVRGVAGIIFKDEIYALRQGQSWVIDAPSFGISFGARTISVFIELPGDYAVRPEAYRQYLRYVGGDQRQVLLLDFADTLRSAMPAWLRQIVNALAPPEADYLAEVRNELQQLLIELDITCAAPPAPPRQTGEPGGRPPAVAGPRPPPARQYEKPPEIITLTDDAMIAERGLVARAARYFPSARQLFINLRCPAVLRMNLHLQHLFAHERDQDRVAGVARGIAEWSIVRMVARALLYSMTKKAEGWSDDDIARAQSPEALTLVADNYQVALMGAHRRMALVLAPGQDPEQDGSWGGGYQGDEAGSLSVRQRREVEMSGSEQAARRALELGRAPPAPFLRRLSEIAMRRRDIPTALDWAHKAVAADPNDAWAQYNLAGVLLANRETDAAEDAALQALRLGADTARSGFLRRLSEVENQRGNTDAAIDWIRKAIDAGPNDFWNHLYLSGLLLTGDDLNGAELAARQALSLAGDKPHSFILRRLGEIVLRRGDAAEAQDWVRRATETDPADAWARHDLAKLLASAGNAAEAEEHARLAVSLSEPKPPSHFLRLLSDFELQKRDLPAAVDLARRAVAGAPTDGWSHNHLAGLLLREGDLTGAEAAARAALAVAGNDMQRATFLRCLSQVQAAQALPEDALATAREAAIVDPNDPWAQDNLAGHLTVVGELDEAEAACRRALTLSEHKPFSGFMVRLSGIHARRKDTEAALAWAEKAVETNPAEPWAQNQLAGALLMRGDLDGAEQAALRAIELDEARNIQFFEETLRRIRARRKALVA